MNYQRVASDSVTDFSAISNPADAQNVFYLGLYGRDIWSKDRYFQPSTAIICIAKNE